MFRLHTGVLWLCGLGKHLLFTPDASHPYIYSIIGHCRIIAAQLLRKNARRCEARAAREAARLAVAVAIATIVPHESGMLVRHHRARLGTLLFTVLRCGGR